MVNLFRLLVALFILIGFSPAQSVTLKDYDYYNYEVLFTNPSCREYRYPREVRSVSGNILRGKPVGAYCTARDKTPSARRSNAPENRIRQWIRSSETKELFFSFLSFSNSSIAREICDAIQRRNVKVKFVLDRNTDLSQANRVLRCRPRSGRQEDRPEMFLRGHSGGIVYAHNKVIIVNPNSESKIRIAFASGNFSSGTVLHHENWHFITTDVRSYFAQAHLCLARTVLESSLNANEYGRAIYQCKRSIRVQEESDIRTFFVPGEGSRAFEAISGELRRSRGVRVAAHRFSFGRLISDLSQFVRRGGRMELIVDDDIYWAGVLRETVGSNTPGEASRVMSLKRSGAKIYFVETNHFNNYLHHNKYLIFYRGNSPSAVFAGAGNLTSAAFNDNHENFYFIRNPDVLRAFDRQYNYMTGRIATRPEDMPRENVQPR